MTQTIINGLHLKKGAYTKDLYLKQKDNYLIVHADDVGNQSASNCKNNN